MPGLFVCAIVAGMKVNGKPRRSIWLAQDGCSVEIIDQTRLPHVFETASLRDIEGAAIAIKDMWVRGAPLIGVTAAYGVALHMRRDASDAGLQHAYNTLLATRPTAVNLRWALDRMKTRLMGQAVSARADLAFAEAGIMADEDVATNAAIGEHGLSILQKLAAHRRGRLNILTHCNAGWLATVDWGTATAPIYKAVEQGIDLHVWVDETRPRNQGASLTAWELAEAGIPHTLIVDNAGGQLMQHGQVDACIVGTDRVTAHGDVCNKIGTYLKALAAFDNNVPFYVALPSSTVDWTINDGIAEVPIEERSQSEVLMVQGMLANGTIGSVRVTGASTGAANPAFDVTPARLVSGLITELGVFAASPSGLKSLAQAMARTP